MRGPYLPLYSLLFLLITGCQPPAPDVVDSEANDAEFEAQISEGRKDDIELESLSNLNPHPTDQTLAPISEPKVERSESEIVLHDLGIKLVVVKFEQPIHGRNQLHFSEGEITNRQFAAYLSDTRQSRDDTEIVAKDKARQNFSTASVSIGVHQPEMHWKDGKFPTGQDDLPVAFLTTTQATSFCDWLTKRYALDGLFRLPEEKEWLAAAYGASRKFPWGDDERAWTSPASEPVLSRPELKTPDGLYGMWGNVSELVLSASNGYGGKMNDFRTPMITKWLGAPFSDERIRGQTAQPRQDYWGYTHSAASRSDTWGFRIVFEPSDEVSEQKP